MKFSLFYELQISNPTRGSEAQLLRDCLEQAKYADELGYHCLWEVEHHGLYEYSHSSAPEVFLAFVAAQTQRIRLGHGCMLLPYRYNHPIRVAERIATLDVLSGGRVNWGSAKSASRVELEAFEIDRSATEAQWCEALHIIPRMWNCEAFSYKGQFFDIPPTHIVPKPLQRPHPPMFAACSDPAKAAKVGAMGVGVLNLATYHDELLAKYVGEYRAAVEQATPVGCAKTNQFCCTAASIVLKDDDCACRVGLRGATFFMQSMLHYYGRSRPVGPVSASRECVTDDQLATFRQRRNTSRSQLSSVIGDPCAARESVQRFVDVGVDELILVMQTGTTPHEQTMESMRTFAEEVMPHFA
jgi:alkanesulfonate monooxygenase SsuD/methylene tetrahydromethanopterin reductase-like flavin-dependent oxidoreductase (luciferase family)